MNIDFHTHYSKEHFEELCKRAKELGLDALVMTGLEENKDLESHGVKIFPAQEVEWVAALNVKSYKG